MKGKEMSCWKRALKGAAGTTGLFRIPSLMGYYSQRYKYKMLNMNTLCRGFILARLQHLEAIPKRHCT